MKTVEQKKQLLRKKRALRVRKRLRGTRLRPRLCVVKTNQHIEVQVIDDEAGETLVSLSTRAKEFRQTEFQRKNKQSARKIGERIAELAMEKNIKEVILDRGPFSYEGIIAELANSARGAGLTF